MTRPGIHLKHAQTNGLLKNYKQINHRPWLAQAIHKLNITTKQSEQNTVSLTTNP